VSRRSRIAVGVLTFFGIAFLMFGVTDILGGPLADRAITVAISGMTPAEVQATDPVGYRLYDFTTRTQGLGLIVIGVLLTLIALIPYRAGQRWAWAVMWVIPAWGVVVPLAYVAYGVAPGAPPAPPMVSGPIIAAVAAVTLLADRRRFADGRAPEPSLELGGATAG
jgi:hypothetical protein